jgi:UDP-N-acetyl-D-galactosamine dehydrogenase
MAEYGLELTDALRPGAYGGVILAVAHNEFTALGVDGIRNLGHPDGHVFYDLKSVFPKECSDLRL